MATRQDDSDAQDNSEFLSEERLEKIGSVNAVLLHQGGYWIHRRKESVTVIDETAVRRTMSVDFTLPEVIDGELFDAIIQHPRCGEPVFCPPLFVLPKASNQLMSFDLTSESSVSLPLMTRRDNARVSGATLVALGERSLGEPLSPGLIERLDNVATANTVRPIAAERMMQAGEADSDFYQLKRLCSDPVFKWWLWTLAHSSLVGVPYRDPTVRRKIFVLSYIESFAHSLRVPTRFGWTPYKVVIDSSWIGARNFHFEAEAPSGLRITKAVLAEDDDDDEKLVRDKECERSAAGSMEALRQDEALKQDEVPTLSQDARANAQPELVVSAKFSPLDKPREEELNREVSGLLRRIHLSRYEASRAGAGTATLDLRVNGPGFVGGALLACGLVVAAVVLCLIRAESIAKNPTSAPAALLLLPGLIATYVGRPDRHALTTRLLLFARWLLLTAGLVAYGCAAFVALGGGQPKTSSEISSRVSHLELVFWAGSVVAVVSFVGLALGWLLANPTARGFLRQLIYFGWVGRVRSGLDRSHFAHSVALPLSGDDVLGDLTSKKEMLLNLKRGRHREAPIEVPHEMAFFRVDRASTWTLRLHVSEAQDEVQLNLHGTCLPRLLLTPLRPMLLHHEARAAERRLRRYGESLRKMPIHPRATRDIA